VTSDPLAPVRYLDVVLVILAAPFVVLMDLPVLGYAVGAIAWILQRLAAGAVDRAAARQKDYRRALGLGMASSMARSWLVALSILAVGLAAEREDGLTAAILVVVAFTVYLATSLTLRALERTPTT
jgi:hypothetical protein